VLKGVYLTPTLKLTQIMQWSVKFLSSYATCLTESSETNHALVLDMYVIKTFNEVLRGSVDFYAKLYFSKLVKATYVLGFSWVSSVPCSLNS